VKKTRKKQSGQAVIEYLFMVVFVVLAFGILINNLATEEPTVGMCRFWGVIVRSVATACANCPQTDVDLGADQPLCYRNF